MAEAVFVYALVALAAAWTVWKVILPRSLKARLSGGKGRAKGCGEDCGCGD